MALVTETVEYFDGDTKCIGTATWNSAIEGPKPGVLIGHNWAGRGVASQLCAEDLAELGYVGFALDVYGDNKTGTSVEENSALMPPLVENRAALLSRLEAGLQAAKAHSQIDAKKVAMIGFCFGGLCALDLARSGADICAAVSFHGILAPNGLEAKPIKASVLVLHGYSDPLAPPEDVTALGSELTQAGCDWQIHAFGHVMHAFTDRQANAADMGMMFNAKAKQRSWAATKQLLLESFASA